MTTVNDTIRTTLGSSVPSGYDNLVEGVVLAVQLREDGIVEKLTSIASSKGLDNDEIDEILIEAGLKEPAPEPVDPEPEVDQPLTLESLAQQVANLAESVNRLVEQR